MMGMILVIAFIAGIIVLFMRLRENKIITINDQMSQWHNRHKNELLTSWGPPTTVFPMENGCEIWSYNEKRRTPGYAHEYSNGHVYIDPPEEYTKKRQFYINEEGIIYNTRWEHF